MALQAGYDKAALFKLDGAAGYTTLAITGHSWKEAIDKLDVTDSSHSGTQALLRGIFRGTGNVKAVYNNTSAPHSAAPGIKAGANGKMQFQTGLGNGFEVPCMITEVQYQSEVAGKVEYSFTVDLNVLSGNGLYVYPV